MESWQFLEFNYTTSNAPPACGSIHSVHYTNACKVRPSDCNIPIRAITFGFSVKTRPIANPDLLHHRFFLYTSISIMTIVQFVHGMCVKSLLGLVGFFYFDFDFDFDFARV